jgi:hypothetical protein
MLGLTDESTSTASVVSNGGTRLGVAASGLEFLERDISYAFIGERHR